MTLDEVLSLEADKKSIKKIDMFLRDKDETSYEYARAIAYKALILHDSDKDKDALRILLSLTPYFNNYDNDSVVALCDTLIDIFLSLDNNDQALKYIDIKNDHLKTIDKDQYLYDMIRDLPGIDIQTYATPTDLKKIASKEAIIVLDSNTY